MLKKKHPKTFGTSTSHHFLNKRTLITVEHYDDCFDSWRTSATESTSMLLNIPCGRPSYAAGFLNIAGCNVRLKFRLYISWAQKCKCKINAMLILMFY